MYHKMFCRQFSRSFQIAIIAAACCTFIATASHAITTPDEGTRQLKVKVAPEYPELAKRMNMKGSVRLELLIAADGRVKDTKVLGGNPVLVQAAEDAARKWRYAPADAESKIIVKFDFDPLMGK